VIWRLGGKHSDFKLGPGARFSWQHDARQPSASTVSLFDDDGADGPLITAPQSRAIVLELETNRRTARLAHAYQHPGRRLSAGAMGSAQLLRRV
jgi:hypothetical protein